MRLLPRILAATSLLLLLAPGRPAPAADGPREIRFNRDIRPILANHCFACHGPDPNTRKAKLRLDVADDALAARADGAAIVAGHPERSELVRHIDATDPDDLMPPPKTGKPLSPAQRQLLRDWIAQGARYEGHWAYQPPVRPPVPTVTNAPTPVRNPIDAFLLDRLHAEGLSASPEADRATLLRRLSLDLTGLPPAPEEVRRFEASRDPRAYGKQVERLLSSPHHGERLATHWLDLVRYADTIGYHGDVPVSVWPYRDYVVRAFNENLPFDRFTREQLAGDLLPNATEQQKIASAFNRLNRMSTEGGIQDKEYLAKYAADRVRTVATTWLGSTLACAECHDHKFDPFSMRDFYSMAAFFADLKEQGFYDRGFSEGNWGPKLLLPTPDQQRRLAKLDADLAAAKKRLEATTDARLAAGRTNWEASVLALDAASNLVWKTQHLLSATSRHGATLAFTNGTTVWAGGPNPDNDTYTVTFQPGPGTWQSLRLETLQDEQYAGNRIARGGTTFIVTGVELHAGDKRARSPRRVRLAHVITDSQDTGLPALAMLDEDPATGWGVPINHSREHQAVFQLAQPLTTTSNTFVTLRLHHDHAERKATIARFRISLSPLARAGLKEPLPEPVLKALRTAPAQRNAEQRKAIAAHYRIVAPELAQPARQLAQLQADRSLLMAQVASTLVSEARDKPRTLRVLPRGNWMSDAGDIVQPAIPRFLQTSTGATTPAPPVGTNAPRASRLDLAAWFTARDNPLTARTVVNRLWKIHFGTGLVRTLDDLGLQGEWPTHPELLDWLACEFMDHGWDVRHVIRLIVTSHAYRQASTVRPGLHERDPQNRLLARQARLRLDAELLRDQALAASGLLVPTLGGPPVRPYQPEGYYAPLNFPKREYVADRGDNLHRRTLYTHLQRTFPHPLLVNFDAPGREECTASRPVSNTPLQALNLLNDPIFVEAARVLAAQTLREGGRRFETRLRWACERVLARPPQPEEARLLQGLLDQQLARYRQDPAAARALLAVGEAPAPKGDPAELAAWTAVTRALLNLNETVTRN
ncbi:MAG: hypothetical protein RJA22_2874 [Verrucomicrobiota bacterium]